MDAVTAGGKYIDNKSATGLLLLNCMFESEWQGSREIMMPRHDRWSSSLFQCFKFADWLYIFFFLFVGNVSVIVAHKNGVRLFVGDVFLGFNHSGKFRVILEKWMEGLMSIFHAWNESFPLTNLSRQPSSLSLLSFDSSLASNKLNGLWFILSNAISCSNLFLPAGERKQILPIWSSSH